MESFGLYYHTIRNLTFRQIFYQVFYRLKGIFVKSVTIYRGSPKTQSLKLIQSIPSRHAYLGDHEFMFLNLQKEFGHRIDWNYSGNKKLWAYNLNYFDFLHQEKISSQEAINLLDSYCHESGQLREGVEPYPISIRGVNWIKFFAYKSIANAGYDSLLYSHYRHLFSNLEYHILGNHLLENAFSLLFGAYYFKDEQFYLRSRRLLIAELNEQILFDGAHFELSTMYHQIILFRLLDCVNLVKCNPWKNDNLLALLEGSSRRMMGWLKSMTFSNGDVPMVNDATNGIAPTSYELFHYGQRLGIDPEVIPLENSGYRMIREGNYELLVDVGNLGPDYILGHAHSDTLNFIMYHQGKPIVVEAGTSTYNPGSRRDEERSTASHNTVVINDQNQSAIWAGFRVGRRAKITHLEESMNFISAMHDGYKPMGITHRRTWQWAANEIVIEDELMGVKAGTLAVASIHLHPDYVPRIDSGVITMGPVKVYCTTVGATMEDYFYSSGFNSVQKGYVIRISFEDRLSLRFAFESANVISDTAMKSKNEPL